MPEVGGKKEGPATLMERIRSNPAYLIFLLVAVYAARTAVVDRA